MWPFKDAKPIKTPPKETRELHKTFRLKVSVNELAAALGVPEGAGFTIKHVGAGFSAETFYAPRGGDGDVLIQWMVIEEIDVPALPDPTPQT